MSDSLGEALPREMARVRDIHAIYMGIQGGAIAGSLMARDLDAAARAMAEGDVVAMLAAHEALKGWEL